MAETGWNQLAPGDAFYNRSCNLVKDCLLYLDLPAELDALISLFDEAD